MRNWWNWGWFWWFRGKIAHNVHIPGPRRPERTKNWIFSKQKPQRSSMGFWSVRAEHFKRLQKVRETFANGVWNVRSFGCLRNMSGNSSRTPVTRVRGRGFHSRILRTNEISNQHQGVWPKTTKLCPDPFRTGPFCIEPLAVGPKRGFLSKISVSFWFPPKVKFWGWNSWVVIKSLRVLLNFQAFRWNFNQILPELCQNQGSWPNFIKISGFFNPGEELSSQSQGLGVSIILQSFCLNAHLNPIFFCQSLFSTKFQSFCLSWGKKCKIRACVWTSTKIGCTRRGSYSAKGRVSAF